MAGLVVPATHVVACVVSIRSRGPSKKQISHRPILVIDLQDVDFALAELAADLAEVPQMPIAVVDR